MILKGCEKLELERLANTLMVMGISNISKAELALLKGANVDIIKLYKTVRNILLSNEIDMPNLNDNVWNAMIELCNLYRMHKFKEDEFYKFCDKFNRMYQYRYKNKDLKDFDVFLSSIHYINMYSTFEIEDADLKVIQDNELYLKYKGQEYWLRADIIYLNRDYIPFLKDGKNFDYKSIGYCINKDGKLKSYAVTAEGLKEFLYDALKKWDEFEVIYMPPFGLNKNNIDKYIEIDTLTNKEFLRLLRWTSVIDMMQIDLVDYTRLEESKIDIKKLMLSLIKKNHFTSKELINATKDMIKQIKNL